MPSGGERAKERYAFSLHPESTAIVRQWLEANGQTMSGWLTGLIDEFAKEIQGQPSAMSKNPEDMSVKEFIDVMQYWFKKASEV